jgi:transcriptional regulator with XRE-family HTH domain
MMQLATRYQLNAAERKLWRRAAGRAILYLRRRRKMEQTELAHTLGILQSQLAKYELGMNRLDDVLVLQIAAVCGISPPRLYVLTWRLYRVMSCRAGLRSPVSVTKHSVKQPRRRRSRPTEERELRRGAG